MKTKFITPIIDSSQSNYIDYWIEILGADYKLKSYERLDVTNILSLMPIHLLSNNNIIELLEKNLISLFYLSLSHPTILTEKLIDKCINLNLINSLHDIPSNFRTNKKYIFYVLEKKPDEIKYISGYDYERYYQKIMDVDFLISLVSKNLLIYFNLFDTYFKKNPLISLLKKSDDFANFFISSLYKEMLLEQENYEIEKLKTENKYLSFKSKFPYLSFSEAFSKSVLKKYFSKNNDALLFFINKYFHLGQFLPLSYRSDKDFVLNHTSLFLSNIKSLHHNILNDFNIMHTLIKQGRIEYQYINPSFLNNRDFALNALISNYTLSQEYDYSSYDLVDLVVEAISSSKKTSIYTFLAHSKYDYLMLNSKVVLSLLNLDTYEKFNTESYLKKTYYRFNSYYSTEKIFQILHKDIQAIVKNDYFEYFNNYGNDTELQKFMFLNFFKYDLNLSLHINKDIKIKSLKI